MVRLNNSLETFCHTLMKMFRFLPPIGNSVWAGSALILFLSDHFHGLGVVQLKLSRCGAGTVSLIALWTSWSQSVTWFPVPFSFPEGPPVFRRNLDIIKYIPVFSSHPLSDDFLKISAQPARVRLRLFIYTLCLLSRLPSQKPPLTLS